VRPPKAITRLAALAALALPADAAMAQQKAPATAPSSADLVSPMARSRGARPMLRNGLDYITYGEYERALEYLRAAETRVAELTPTERQQLAQGIARAQQGLRAADPAAAASGTALAGGTPGKAPAQARLRAGAIALSPTPTPGPAPTLAQTPSFAPAPPAPAPAPAMAPEPIQLTGGTAEPMGFGVSRATSAAAVSAPALSPPPLPVDPAPSLDRPSGPPALDPSAAPAAMSSNLPILGVQEGDPLAPDPSPAPSPSPVSDGPAAASSPSPAPSPELVVPPEPEMPSNPPDAIPDLPAPPTTVPSSELMEPIRSVPEANASASEVPSIEAPAATEPPPPSIEAPAAEAPAPAPVVEAPASLGPPPPSIEAPAVMAAEGAPAPPSIETPTEPAPAPEPTAPSVAPEPAAAPEPVSGPGAVAGEAGLPALPLDAAALQPAGPAMPPLPGDDTSPPPPSAEEMTAPTALPPTIGTETPPSPSPTSAADAARDTTLGAGLAAAASEAAAGAEPSSLLPPQVRREVEDVARNYQRDLINQRSQIREPLRQPATAIGAGPLNLPGGVPSLIGPPLASGGESSPTESRIELPRVPSPTEPRPIRSIPVPEEYVPLKPREWSPSRKVWAAAATCHTPLYFQDASLERYGMGVEQALGPHYGRFASIPLDDPTQSNQRQQLLQPFWSVGKFGAQIAMWPVNMIFNPPWEAEYDLGYWRPGDRVPPDTLYWPLTGVGPPFRGKKY
jgi:hypothetical protein